MRGNQLTTRTVVKTAAGAAQIAAFAVAFAATTYADTGSATTELTVREVDGIVRFEPRITNVPGDPDPTATELAAMYPNLGYVEDMNLRAIQDFVHGDRPPGLFDWLYSSGGTDGLTIVDADSLWDRPASAAPLGDRFAEGNYTSMLGVTGTHLTLGSVAPPTVDIKSVEHESALENALMITVVNHWDWFKVVLLEHDDDPTAMLILTPFLNLNLTPAVDIDDLVGAADTTGWFSIF